MPQINLALLPVSASTIHNTGALGTASVKIADFTPATGFSGVRQVKLTNKSAAAYVAYKLTTEASPAFVASAAGVIGPTEGVVVLPLGQVDLNFPSTLGLWVVASAASTPVQVATFDSTVR